MATSPLYFIHTSAAGEKGGEPVMEDSVFSEYECRLARLALQNRYLTRNQIQTCLTHRKEAGSVTTLEDVLLERTYLTPEEVDELSRLVSAEASTEGNITRLFARIARRRLRQSARRLSRRLRLIERVQ